MSLFNFGKNNKASAIRKMLDDLTYLEINTIIKKGMTAAPQPDSMKETLKILFDRYRTRMKIIGETNDVPDDARIDFLSCNSISEFHGCLTNFQKKLDEHRIRLAEHDYIRLLRMVSFCQYIKTKSEGEAEAADENALIKLESANGAIDQKSLYQLDLSEGNLSRYQMDVKPRDRVKLKRLFDLGTENVVMQTRFGLDGDVVTRIEQDFANQPRQLVIDMHDKHTQLTLNYWKDLIGLVQQIIGKII
jgi:hypothetical protein